MAEPSTDLRPLKGNFIDALVTGHYWNLNSSRVIYWSISDGFDGDDWANPDYMVNIISGMLENIETYVDLDFQYVGHFTDPEVAYQNGSDINYSLDSGRYMDSPNYWAIGHFPSTWMEWDYEGQAGDIFLNINSPANELNYKIGGAGYALLLHETGHALGLKHPHDDGGTGRPTFQDYDLDEWDIEYMSIMSYKDSYGWDLFTYEPMTPMVLDVLGLQYLYGSNYYAATGNTIWNIVDNDSYFTINDSSGYDTLDVSGSSEGWTIDISNTHSANDINRMYTNSGKTFNWLLGDYEFLVGSDYDDILIGAEWPGTEFQGGKGSDIIIGGIGNDTAFYLYSSDSYLMTEMTDGSWHISGRESDDILIDIEYIGFSDGIFDITSFSIASPFIIDRDNHNWDNAIDTGDGQWITAEDAQLYRSYLGAMGRIPDAGGFNWWANEIDEGRHSLYTMADGFISSSEFKGYADTDHNGTISNHEFISHMYEDVFGRAPDQEGYDYWMGELNSGSSDQGEVFIHMTQSNEYIDQTLNIVGAYLFA